MLAQRSFPNVFQVILSLSLSPFVICIFVKLYSRTSLEEDRQRFSTRLDARSRSIDRSIFAVFVEIVYLYKNLRTEAKRNERQRKCFLIIVVTNVQIRITYIGMPFCGYRSFIFSVSHTCVFFVHLFERLFPSNFEFRFHLLFFFKIFKDQYR